ncbi:MAG: hypothetical protein CL907_02905 [Dehalococcoidia bacterium]|nr:hypothetical protein [Dehalococcoidia bacterium]|tara:strand:+ start:103 stop:1599 length:1497 start_codon:yes stop_codon:yes gene_type:complete
MKKNSLVYILNPFLLVIFFIIFFYSSNLGEIITPLEIFSLILIFTLFEMLAFLIAAFTLKDLRKSSIFLTVITFIFLSYGYVYDLFNQIDYAKNIFRHRYLVPLIVLFLSLLFIYLKRKKNNYNNIYKIFFTTIIILIFANIFQIFTFNQKPTSVLSEYIAQEYVIEDNAPDVFHIVLDMYPTNKILESRFNFNNDKFSEELINLGFKNEDLKANYIRTMYSLPSTFNINHFYNASKSEINYMKETLHKFNMSVEGQLAKKLGYDIHEISTNDVNSFYSSFLGDFSRVFIRTSILRVIDDSSIPLHNLWINKNQKYFSENLDKLIHLSKEPNKTWTFFYSRPPHPPFIFNEDGSRNLTFNPYNAFSEDLSDTWTIKEKENFINQLKYVNKKIVDAIRLIISNSSNVIIIIHSDHGINNMSGKDKLTNGGLINEIYEEQFSTISYIYTPDYCSKNKDLIKTNINIIPTLLRNCFNIELENKENLQFWNAPNKEDFILIK